MRRQGPAAFLEWLRSCGWVVVGPPVRFFCDESCAEAAARDVTPPEHPRITTGENDGDHR